MSKSFKLKLIKVPLKKRRSLEKAIMDRETHPKVFRSLRGDLRAQEATKEVNDYLRGGT